MDFNWTDNIVFIPDSEWISNEDFDWEKFTEIVVNKTGLYPIDKGSEPIVILNDGVNYHFGLVSKEDYIEWMENN